MPLRSSDIDKILLDACPDASTKKAYLRHCFILKLIERLTYALIVTNLVGIPIALWDFLVI